MLAPFAQDYERLWLHEPVARVVAHDRAFEHGLVLKQAVLDLRGRDEDARDFEHVVRAAVVPIITFLVLREGHAPGEDLARSIKEFVKSRLALYKYPRWVEFVPSLPKNDRGKIDRKKLKEQ